MTCTDSEKSSDEQDGSSQDTTHTSISEDTPLSEDSHQHGLILAAYRDVGNDHTVGQRPGCKASGQCLEGGHQARLTVPLLKCVDHLDRVLAGCCWEVFISRQDPENSLSTLRQSARSLTLTLASYLSEFVARTLRASRTSQGAPLTDEEKIHLLAALLPGSNPCVTSCCMRLFNASVKGERKRPCSGLVKIMAN